MIDDNNLNRLLWNAVSQGCDHKTAKAVTTTSNILTAKKALNEVTQQRTEVASGSSDWIRLTGQIESCKQALDHYTSKLLRLVK